MTDPADQVNLEEGRCVVCGGSPFRKLFTASHFLYGRAGAATIVRCLTCGHCYCNPRPGADVLPSLYTDAYGPHQAAVTAAAVANTDSSPLQSPPTTVRPWYARPPFRWIPGLRALYHWLSRDDSVIVPVCPRPAGYAFEIGCGSGAYLEKLQQAGWTVEGVELGTRAAEYCRARGFTTHLGHFDQCSPARQAYDLVALWMVLEHLDNPAAALRRIREILQPDGLLLLSVPNFGCWETTVFRGYHYLVNEPTHLSHFTVSSLTRLLNDGGFQVERIVHQANVYNVVGSLGILLRQWRATRALGDWCLDFCEHPRLWLRLALAPLAKLLTLARQAGRITVVARRVQDGRRE